MAEKCRKRCEITGALAWLLMAMESREQRGTRSFLRTGNGNEARSPQCRGHLRHHHLQVGGVGPRLHIREGGVELLRSPVCKPARAGRDRECQCARGYADAVRAADFLEGRIRGSEQQSGRREEAPEAAAGLTEG